MQTRTLFYAEAKLDEHAIHAVMPAVRRTLPWRVRQQNLAYRLAERARVPTIDSDSAARSAAGLEASAHFNFTAQNAEYFLDVCELERAFDDTRFRPAPSGDEDVCCR